MLSDFTFVKIIKDYSLTRQGENSTYSKISAQCRTRQHFRKTLKKIEQKTKKKQHKNYLPKDNLRNADTFIRTQKRYKYAAVHYGKDLPLGIFVRYKFEGK